MSAVPPSWKDLGKASSDLLGKGKWKHDGVQPTDGRNVLTRRCLADYPTSGQSLEVKTRAPNNVSPRKVLVQAMETRSQHSSLRVAGALQGCWQPQLDNSSHCW